MSNMISTVRGTEISWWCSWSVVRKFMKSRWYTMKSKKSFFRTVEPYLYLVPVMILFILFVFWPFVKTIQLSFARTTPLGQVAQYVATVWMARSHWPSERLLKISPSAAPMYPVSKRTLFENSVLFFLRISKGENVLFVLPFPLLSTLSDHSPLRRISNTSGISVSFT